MLPSVEASLLALRTDNTTSENAPRDTYMALHVAAFNPYQTMIGITPSTYYECLSILNAFTPLSCARSRGYDKMVVLDLDPTDGCTMALQTRYPRCIIYCSSLKVYGTQCGLDARDIMCEKRTPRTITEYMLMYNARGADFAFCVDQDVFDLSRQVTYGMTALNIGTTMALRVNNVNSVRVRRAIAIMLPWFTEVTVYKCATMSCVNSECYVVGVGKLKHGDSKGELRGLDAMESFIRRAQTSIMSRVDNTDIAHPLTLKNEYIGL